MLRLEIEFDFGVVKFLRYLNQKRLEFICRRRGHDLEPYESFYVDMLYPWFSSDHTAAKYQCKRCGYVVREKVEGKTGEKLTILKLKELKKSAKKRGLTKKGKRAKNTKINN